MQQTDQSTSAEEIKKASTVHFSLGVETRLLPIFFQLLGDGFKMFVPTNCSVKELLCSHLNIQEDYLENRIQTIILNGRAVDNVNSATVEQGSTLALSGAMPGLVGAILRRGGVLAPMRRQISHRSDSSAQSGREVQVIVKLFNLIAKELGPTLLQRGLWLKGKQLQDFILENFDYLKQECKSLKLDEQDIDISKLAQINLTSNWVQLQVETGQKADFEYWS